MLVGDIAKILDPPSLDHVNHTWKQHIPNRTYFGQPFAPGFGHHVQQTRYRQ